MYIPYDTYHTQHAYIHIYIPYTTYMPTWLEIKIDATSSVLLTFLAPFPVGSRHECAPLTHTSTYSNNPDRHVSHDMTDKRITCSPTVRTGRAARAPPPPTPKEALEKSRGGERGDEPTKRVNL